MHVSSLICGFVYYFSETSTRWSFRALHRGARRLYDYVLWIILLFSNEHSYSRGHGKLLDINGAFDCDTTKITLTFNSIAVEWRFTFDKSRRQTKTSQIGWKIPSSWRNNKSDSNILARDLLDGLNRRDRLEVNEPLGRRSWKEVKRAASDNPIYI